MEINVKFTVSEFEMLLDAIRALKGDIEQMCGSQESIDAAYENVRALELHLRDTLKGVVAKAIS